MNPEPSFLTSPDEALARVEGMEAALLDAAMSVLYGFLEWVAASALNGNLTRASVVEEWKNTLARRLSHPMFTDVREGLLVELDSLPFADDVYTATEMALEIAHNMGATPDERRELLEGLFAPPHVALLASLSARVDGWLRKRLSKLLLRRIRNLGADDLTREDLLGPEFIIPEMPGVGSTVTTADWELDDREDRPHDINWEARMRRDIRTAYTMIFGRQMQRQLERYGFLQKKWISRKDARVRLAHLAAHGQTVGLFETFDVGGAPLRYPGDPLGPPGQTINCRCVLIGVR